MEKCHEYLGCTKLDCVMFEIKDKTPCWKVDGTLCNHLGIQDLRDEVEGAKEKICEISGCIYYQTAKARGLTSRSTVNSNSGANRF